MGLKQSPDDFREEDKECAGVATFCFAGCLAVITLLILIGCAPVQVAPNLRLPDISTDKNPAKECPKLVMPPVSDDVELDIKGDKIVKLNAGGDVLLRGYARARTLLKPDAP